MAILGAAFVARALIVDWPRASGLLAEASLGWLALALSFSVVSLSGIACVWTISLGYFLPSVTLAEGLRWYFPGELGKYVPGGVWALLGRAELAVRGGVTRPAAYAATIWSLAATYSAAFVLIAVTLPSHSALHNLSAPSRIAAALVLGVLASSVIFVPTIISRVRLPLFGRFALLGRYLIPVNEIGTGRLMTLIALSIPTWFGMGAATWFVTVALDVSIPLSEVLFATSAAWLIGFLVLPAPSGIGVREAVFVAALTSVSPGTASAIAIIARVVSMAADVVGALLSFMFASRKLTGTQL